MSVSLGPSRTEATGASRARFTVSLEELRNAWAAVVAGEFRPPAVSRAPSRSLPTSAPMDLGRPAHESRTVPDALFPVSTRTWEHEPSELVLPVIGSVGSCGATTLALAAATAAVHTQGRRARVIECASLSATGLAAASTSELGADPRTGWTRGVRDDQAQAATRRSPAAGAGAGGRGVVLERVSTILTRVDEVPSPAAGRFDLTVLDVGWEPGQLLATPSWVTDQVLAQTGLAVTTATAPGLRRLEVTLSMLPRPQSWCVAVVGPRRRRWASTASREIGPLTGALLDAGRLIEVPPHRHLATAGLTGAPLPRALVAAGAAALDHAAAFCPHSQDDLAEAFGDDRTQVHIEVHTQEGTS